MHAEQAFELCRPLPVAGTARITSTVTGIYDMGWGGFATPILHGLCTYGFTGRALLHAVCGGDPARFGSMSGRFSHPVLPGETLVTSIWRDDGGALFQTAKQDGTVVIDRGRMRVRD